MFYEIGEMISKNKIIDIYLKIYINKSRNNTNIVTTTNPAPNLISAMALYKRTQIKYDLYREFMRNTFIDDRTKQEFMEVFYKMQRTSRLLTRCIMNKIHKTRLVHNTTDLYQEPIYKTSPHVLALHEGKFTYLFTHKELIHLMLTALTYIDGPLAIKNPYNNKPFTKSALYNIYFALSDHFRTTLPILLHLFFLCEMNSAKFAHTYKHEIFEYVLYCRLLHPPTHIIHQMLEFYNNRIRIDHMNIREPIREDGIYKEDGSSKYEIRIDPDFPEDVLMDAFKPALRAFYVYRHETSTNNRRTLKQKFMLHLVQFSIKNQTFGRKLYYTNTEEALFQTKYINVVQRNKLEIQNRRFLYTHLPNNTDEYDSDEYDE